MFVRYIHVRYDLVYSKLYMESFHIILGLYSHTVNVQNLSLCIFLFNITELCQELAAIHWLYLLWPHSLHEMTASSLIHLVN